MAAPGASAAPPIDALDPIGLSRGIAERLVAFSPPEAGHRVLDLGCGHGPVSAAVRGLGRPGPAVVAVDRSPAALGRLSTGEIETGVLTASMDVHGLALCSGSFDRVYGSLVLDLSPHPEVALAEALRVTRDGGVSAFACRHRECPYFGTVFETLADLVKPRWSPLSTVAGFEKAARAAA